MAITSNISVEVVLDSRESLYYDFRLPGIPGVFRAPTHYIDKNTATEIASQLRDRFEYFAAANLARGEAFKLSDYFSRLGSNLNAVSAVAWYSMPYGSKVRPELQMNLLYPRLNPSGVKIREGQVDLFYFFRDA